MNMKIGFCPKVSAILLIPNHKEQLKVCNSFNDTGTVAHQFGRVEFGIFVVVFLRGALEKNQNKYSIF